MFKCAMDQLLSQELVAFKTDALNLKKKVTNQ